MIPVLIHLRCIHQQTLMAQFHGVHIKRFGNGERSGGSDSLFDPAMRQCVQDEFHCGWVQFQELDGASGIDEEQLS